VARGGKHRGSDEPCATIHYGDAETRPAVCRLPENKESPVEATQLTAACKDIDPDCTYVIIQICKLDRGLPLLPVGEEAVWRVPANSHIHLAEYLAQFLSIVTGEGWEERVHRAVDSLDLTRYQAAVLARDWQRVWDALLQPFSEQRRNYRKLYRCKNAPDLLFGVAPRLRQPRATPEDSTQSPRAD
jgi:hypothetical protein